ncbi:MAG: hypothetical protein IT459_06300 [Planctomycetes bacterium]|nr:hypothetical protein [Planctomycetota bacterium]
MSQSKARIAWALAAIVSVTGFASEDADAQSLAYDGFGNGPRPNLAGSTGGTGWTSAWVDAGTDITKIAGNGLSYPGLDAQIGAAVTPTAGGVWPSTIYARSFIAPPSGTNTIYASFLMRDDAAYGSWGGVSFGQYPTKVTVGSPLGYYQYGLMMSQGLGDVASKPLVQGQTTLVVVKITKNATGASLTYRLFLDPTIGSNEPGFAAATLSVGGAMPTAISIDNGTGFTTDEIRVGTTWSSVLPAAPQAWKDLGFAKPGALGAPHLAGTGPLSANTPVSLDLTDTIQNAPTFLVLGPNAVNLPFLGGILVPNPSILVALQTNASGRLTLSATWPVGIPAGTTLCAQMWIQDPAATFGFAASNGLLGTSH